MKLTLYWTGILLTILCTCAMATPVLARDSQDVIEDADYRFRLRRPGPAWFLLPEAEVRNIVPDAIAGARLRSGTSVHGCMIVEKVPKEDLDWFSSLVLDNMPLENRRIVKKEDIEFNGVAARRTLIEGRVNNLEVRYQVVMLFRQGHAFQIMAWGLAAQVAADGSDFTPFFAAIEFTEGPIRMREYVAAVHDTVGTGWEVKNNEFRSVVSGLHVVPPKGWRLAIGDELATMNEDAHVGLISTGDPTVYMVFTSELIVGVERAALEAQYAAGLEEMQGRSTTIAPLVATVAGQLVKLAMYGGKPEQPFDYRFGVLWDGDMSLQILIWYGRPTRKAATQSILRALAGVRKLGAEEQGTLRQRLIEAGSQQAFVGPTYSLRGGRFTDYANGVTWTAPKGIWKVSTGQAARAFSEGATLVIESPTRGLFGVLRHDPDLQTDAATYHRDVLELLWGKEDAAKALPRTKVLQVPKRPPLRIARAVRGAGIETFSFVVATGLNGKIGTRFMVWGYPGNVAKAAQWLNEAIGTLDLAGAPELPAQRQDDRWIDHRLGFEIQSPNPLWHFRDETPAALRAVGSLVRWGARKERVQVLGICNIGIAEKTPDLLESVLGNATRPFGSQPARRSPVTIQGLPGETLRWPQRAQLWTLVRGRMIYLLIHEWAPGTKPSLSAEAILSRFKLLE